MTGLVLELQRDALNPNVQVADLLRKALVVSRKLGLSEMQDWIEAELGGYETTEQCPSYRKAQGEVKVFNPYRGWQPVAIQDKDLAETICSRMNTQSIGELEDLLRSDSTVYHMQFSGRQQAMIGNMIGMNLEASLHVSRQTIVKVLDGVRNRILEWSLDLEKRNILGSGLTFSREEKVAASQISYHTVTNIGTMTNSQLQQNSSGSQTIGSDVTVDLAKLVESITNSVRGLSLDRDTIRELEAELAALRSQANSPKPKVGIVKESLLSIKNILEGAAGNVVASELVAKLVPLLGALS